ncbi:CusA/CzcA family heavy metal efflux RND transporter [Myxococcota bacterium]|nr:CusA/CzcA family heavy metal efflux RND transporter [Myxococcota bacterium]
MLTRILELSLKHPIAVLVAWALIAVVGVLSALRLPLDAFPDTTPVQVQINAVAPALSPLEIERQLTAPIEWSISGVPKLVDVRSVSKFGFSQVTATFEDDMDVYFARQLVAERLSTVELPPGIDRPELGPVSTGLGEVFHFLLQGEGQSLAELRTLQDWVVKPQLRSVPGVAEVNAWGGDERQVEVVVDPARLQKSGVTLDQLTEAIEANNLNVGGGTLDRAGESALVRGIGLVTSAEELGEIVITAHLGSPVRVRDVADVRDGRELRRGAVTADGKGEVVLGLAFILAGGNSRELSSRLAVRLQEIQKSLPGGVRATVVHSRAELVDRVLSTVKENLAIGALLVVSVLFAFLGNLRAGLIVAAAIPLSMLFASNLMLQAGIAGSLMSLGAIDFGLIVDSSVIQIENVMRRLEGEPGRSRFDVVRDAVHEVRKPTLFGELIIAIVYLPVLTLEGMEGKLFRPMALTVIFALAGSLLASMTLMPVLAHLGLPQRTQHRENRLLRGLLRAYRPVLAFALDRPKVVLGTSLGLVCGAMLLSARLGSEFVPRLQEGSLVVNTVRLAGVSAEESVRYGTEIERLLLEKFPDEIEHLWTRTGSPEVTTDPMGLEVSDVFINLTPPERWARGGTQGELAAAIAEELESLPGMRFNITQPIEMRINEMAAGIRAEVGIRLFGDDFEVLEAKALEIREVLSRVPGASDIVVEQVTGQPVVDISVDRSALARAGVAAREVLELVETFGTKIVGLLFEGERRFPIVVRLDERLRHDEDAIGDLLVSGPEGQQLPLRTLARIATVEGPSTITREWGQRRIVVQTNVRDRDLGSFVHDAKEAIRAEVELPPGYFVRFGGQFEHLERARTRLLVVVPLALALIFTMLYFTYGRALDAIRVFTGVPTSAIGGIVALWVRDMPFSISAGVGFVVLSGVAVLGDMVLASTIRQNLGSGMQLREAIEQAATTRLRPVLMTALVASLGFLPMALHHGFGAEVQRPLATVVIGGLLSSTVLTLVLLPVLYSVMTRGSSRR